MVNTNLCLHRKDQTIKKLIFELNKKTQNKGFEKR